MGSDVVLVIVVATALAFDFTNGFHDTANAIATSVSTRAMSPRFAVLLSAVLNFAGAFISLKVAATVASGIVDPEAITTTVVFAGLIGAIAWNLATWWFGLPSSSSHALIGGVVGAAFAADGASAVLGDGVVEKVIVPGLVAPVLAFVVAGAAILSAYRIVGRVRPGPVNRGYRLGQLVSGSLFSLAHGTNDAQKTMGIITLALIAHGNLPADSFDVPFWVILSSAAAIALGTYTGGWRIIRTVGSRIIKMDPAQGFAAQGAGAAVGPPGVRRAHRPEDDQGEADGDGHAGQRRGPHELEQLAPVDGGERHPSAVSTRPCATRRPKMAASRPRMQSATITGPSAPLPNAELIA